MTPRRRLRPDEARLWAMVAATVAGARVSVPPASLDDAADSPSARASVEPTHRPAPPALDLRPRASAEALASLIAAGIASRGSLRQEWGRSSAATAPGGAAPIEPNRRRRIARDREPIGARLDLHGHDQDAARAALHAFIGRAHHDGLRAVLVITGQGRTGGGVLRLRTPEWLAESPSRGRVAGVSVAEARHGGQGALYVALKRRE